MAPSRPLMPRASRVRMGSTFLVRCFIGGSLGVQPMTTNGRLNGSRRPGEYRARMTFLEPSSFGRRDRGIDENLVLLHPRLGFIVLVDELERAFAGVFARQHHDADEAARPVGGGLRKHRVGAGLIP